MRWRELFWLEFCIFAASVPWGELRIGIEQQLKLGFRYAFRGRICDAAVR